MADSLGMEDHVEIGFFGGFWNDRSGDQEWAYVVEYGGIQAAAVPLPGAGFLLVGGLSAVTLGWQEKA